MPDGKRLNSSLGLLKRHYPQVASLRDYISSILRDPTEIALTIPDDPEEYLDLLGNSKVGYHQLPCRKYRAGAPVFEIDEVDRSNIWSPLPTYMQSGHQKITVVSPPCSKYSKKRHYRWIQGTLGGTFRLGFLTPLVGGSRGNHCQSREIWDSQRDHKHHRQRPPGRELGSLIFKVCDSR